MPYGLAGFGIWLGLNIYPSLSLQTAVMANHLKCYKLHQTTESYLQFFAAIFSPAQLILQIVATPPRPPYLTTWFRDSLSVTFFLSIEG